MARKPNHISNNYRLPGLIGAALANAIQARTDSGNTIDDLDGGATGGILYKLSANNLDVGWTTGLLWDETSGMTVNGNETVSGSLGVGSNNVPATTLHVQGTTGIRIEGTGTNTDIVDLVPGIASSADRIDFFARNTNRGIGFLMVPNGTSTIASIAMANQNSAASFGSLKLGTRANRAIIGLQNLGAPTTPIDTLIIGSDGTFGTSSFASVSIGPNSPTASAALDVNSTTGAFMPPRMTTTQRNALTASNGMEVYDTTVGAFFDYTAGAWVQRGSGSGTPVLVSALPSAATVGSGARAFVSDANSPTFGSTVAGSGSTPCPVYSDGTNWKVG